MKWLSDRTGISASMLSDYRRGKTPGADKALAIAEVLGADVKWLLTGAGAEPRFSAVADRQLAYRAPAPEISDDLVEIAEINLRYGLGASYIDSEEAIESEQRPFSRAWLRSVTESPPSMLFWAKGQGNSMSPTIEDGEVVLIDRSQTRPMIDDLIFACSLGTVGMIKRLRPRADHVKLLSDNASVAGDIAHEADNFHIIGRVVAVVKRI